MADGVQSLGRVESVPKGITAFFSCDATETSYEDAELGHGVFTHYLIKGLAGEAARDGIITILGLYEYVQKETQTFTKRKYGESQIPYWSGEFTNFILRDDLLVEGVSREQWQKANESYQQAITLRKQGLLENAMSYITESLKILPPKQQFLTEKELIESAQNNENHRIASGHNKSAMVHFEKGDYSKALKEIERALELFPHDEGFLHTRKIIRQAIVVPRDAVLADFLEWEAHYKRYGDSSKFILANVLTKRAYWKSAAEKGMPEAQLLYGNCYHFDLDGVQNDHKKKIEWYMKAAEKNWPLPNVKLGVPILMAVVFPRII